MEKFCVFCGKKPEGKSREHIIPKWLIELTGNPKRKAFFGFDFASKKLKIRNYDFNSFSFPACYGCNHEFSNLESKSKKIVVNMLENKEINDIDISCLLDWLDKVRIGLWLGFLILSNNWPGINPKFHIKKRVAAADRLLFIYKLPVKKSGINFIGTESPSFLYVPSSFALRINNYCFFNVSHFNLCDRRLGFPYAKEAYYIDSDLKIEAEIVEGLERCFYPVIRKYFLSNCSRFFQPIFSQHIKNKDFCNLFDTDYIRNNSIDSRRGIGKVFQELNDRVITFPRQKTSSWIPPSSNNSSIFFPRINQQVYDFQIGTINLISTNKLSKEDRCYFLQEISFCKRANSSTLELVEKNVDALSFVGLL